jgi:hypothetical protein
MKEALVVARREILNVNRERLAVTLLAVFLGMVLVSATIGWSTRHTVMSVYDETVLQTGRNLPNPFSEMSALELIKNTVSTLFLSGPYLPSWLALVPPFGTERRASPILYCPGPSGLSPTSQANCWGHIAGWAWSSRSPSL